MIATEYQIVTCADVTYISNKVTLQDNDVTSKCNLHKICVHFYIENVRKLHLFVYICSMQGRELADCVFKVIHITEVQYSEAGQQAKDILRTKEITNEQLSVLMFEVPTEHNDSSGRPAYYIPYVNLINFIRLF